MKLIYQKNHPNGFKIFLASKVVQCSLSTECSEKSIRNGAQLEIYDSQNLPMNLDPNSAVLKLWAKQADLKVLEWIEWENILQEYLSPYLISLSSGKSSDSLSKSLSDVLQKLDCSIQDPSKFLIAGELSAADVVLFSALLPLFVNPKSVELLKTHQNLHQYLSFLRSQTSFKESELTYYGESGVSLQPWILSHSAPASSSQSLWSLRKSESTQSEPVPEKPSEDEVTESELKAAESGWREPVDARDALRVRATPVLPVKGESNVLVTSALPYVNNVPHLGNIIGCVLSADCFSRFCRLRGDNVLYVCGTDEYGTATETKALAEGMTPKQICDKYHAIHSDVYKWFNIDFDYFGRTTTNSQTEAAQSIFRRLEKNGRITKNRVDQLFCTNCQKFLADRFVEGTCPQIGCAYEDARGDQCDACGKLVNATELIKPRCKICSQTPAIRTSSHLFIDLPNIEPDLKEWMKSSSVNWSSNARGICESWIKDGLKERCITRDLKWGTPVPLEGYTDKVFYVWYDAPIGYVSMTMEYTNEWEKWWKSSENISFYQFMAKDNVPFHGVIFPSCQIGTQDKWTKVTHLMATEYLNYEDGKFSKSRGVGVFGDQAQSTGIPSDVWRFYLLYVRPESQDTSFSWSDLQFKNNSELLNNIGNFINRSLKFVFQFYKGVVPEASLNSSDYKVIARVNKELEKYTKSLNLCKLRDGIRYILSITRLGNQYIQDNEPYKLIKPDRSLEDRERGATVISVSVNMVALVAVLLQPYMPDTSKRVLDVLNNPQHLGALPSKLKQYIKPGHKIKEPSPLIMKITDDQIEALRKQFSGSPESQGSAKTPPSKGAAPVAVPNGDVPLTPKDPQEIKKIEDMVAEQGTKVRDLKGQGVAKDVLAGEIEQLLRLKETLALAQGLDPASVRNTGKKGKKK